MAKLYKTIRQDKYKKVLEKLMKDKPEARLLKNRKRVLVYTLKQEWATLMTSMGIETFIDDVIYLDRQIRKATEGYDIENKKIAEQEYLLENGYEVGVDNQVDKLKTL